MFALGFRTRLATFLALLTAIVAPPLHAQEACSAYTVQPGDTLGSISMAAFGRLDYQVLYNANVEVLRLDPSVPPPGTILRIPCEDGRISADDSLPGVPEAITNPAIDPTIDAASEVTDSDAAFTAYRPMIRIVSGDDWVPFADPSLTGGGLFLRITTTALDRAGPEYRHTIGWVEDWESHIFALLPSGAFDLATGWYDPDCENLANPSERTQFMCDNFLFSEPIYDSAFAFFSRADNPYAAARTFADLTGARFCRAEGNLFHDLEAQGLMEPAITIQMEDEEEGCLEGLLEGRYDVASFEAQYAPAAFAALGITDEIVQSASLTSIQSSVAIAHKSNPRAQAYIDHLNRGLAILRDSGEWTDIVTGTLAEAESLAAAE
ncbi:MAG: hypothetical protein B7Y02_08160 [Rhodobacterales bacterium 17-64-5]|nr:MAG: hypothetical protein B7Y02_08160 [Rhodobacterales bacterium 17-64-5]